MRKFLLKQMTLFFTTFTTLFSVVNPLGAMPVFLALTGEDVPAERNKQALKASIYAISILVISFLVGSYILDFFQISIEGMRIAAGMILMQTGFNLISANYKKNKSIDEKVEEEASEKEDISFFPLALPMLSGPGSISLLIGVAAETSVDQYVWILLAILLTCICSYSVLRLSPTLIRVLGRSGIKAMSKLMGFIVLTVGVQYIINGVLPLLQVILDKL